MKINFVPSASCSFFQNREVNWGPLPDIIEARTACKSAHFLLVRMDYSLERLAKQYINDLVRLHGVSVSLYQIEIQGSLLDSGVVSKKP